MAIKDWIKKHRSFLRREGGMNEKKKAIEFQNQVSEKIKQQLDKLSIEHPLHSRVTDHG